MNSRSSWRARAIFKSRVVPATGLTIARVWPTMRLNNVDLPTFARPTSTTTASPSAAAARDPFESCDDVFNSRRISESQLLELARVGGPPPFHLDVRFEEDAPAENLLEFEPGAGTDQLELRASRPDYHAFVRVALDDYHRRDFHQAALGLLDKLLDLHRRRKGNLLTHREENLLPDNLFGDHSLGLIGVFVGGHQRRALRQQLLEDPHQLTDIFARERADRNDFGAGQYVMRLVGDHHQAIARDQIQLVNYDDGRRLEVRKVGEKRAILRMEPRTGLHHASYHLALCETSARRLDHPAVERAVRLMEARRVDQNNLRVRIVADTEDTPARGLRLGCDDRHLLLDDTIEQGGLADVATAAERHKARAMGAIGVHDGPVVSGSMPRGPPPFSSPLPSLSLRPRPISLAFRASVRPLTIDARSLDSTPSLASGNLRIRRSAIARSSTASPRNSSRS